MSRKNGHGGQNHCHPPEITYRSQTILGKTAGYAGVFYLREVQFESQNTTSTAFFQSKSSFSNVFSRSTPCFLSVPPRCVFHNPRSGVVLSTKRTYMDLPRSDMQRRALRALVTLCLVFFAGAILVLTSFATPALADENSYNSENIASAGAGSNGSVVVMAPAAAPQPAAASSSAAEPVAAPRSAAAAIPMPASAGSAAVTTPAAAPKAAAEAVAFPLRVLARNLPLNKRHQQKMRRRQKRQGRSTVQYAICSSRTNHHRA